MSQKSLILPRLCRLVVVRRRVRFIITCRFNSKLSEITRMKPSDRKLGMVITLAEDILRRRREAIESLPTLQSRLSECLSVS